MILPGRGADIGPPVAADFRFIMHAAKTDADERPIHRRARSTGPAKVLPTPGWSDKTEYRRLALRRASFSHRQILDDPALDLLQTVMILVEDATRLRYIDGFFQAADPHGSSINQSR